MIWFDEPLPEEGDTSRMWQHRALPIGNGAMGAVVYGGVSAEKLQLNEKTLWSGGPGSDGGYDYGNWTDGRGPETIAEVRQLIADSPTGGIAPDDVAAILGKSKANFGSYQTLGNLVLAMANEATASDYRRELDLGAALAQTTYTAGGVEYTRAYFASAEDHVIVVRLTANTPGSIGFTASYEVPDRREDVAKAAANGRMTVTGTVRGNGLRWATQVQVLNEGGSISEDSDAGTVTVSGADSATLIIGAATDYSLDYASDYRSGIDPQAAASRTVERAARKSYASLLRRHQRDFCELFDRVELDLDASLPELPTDELLTEYRNGDDAEAHRALEQLYFQYGRYLLIASSRAGSLPANLQGVWNHVNNPPWSADYHVNINLQMNYWPAETTNLSETTAPLFDFVDSLVPPGTITATNMYGAQGWVVGNETNPFGFTGLHNYPQSFWQPDAAAWLAQHYWQHYLFTPPQTNLWVSHLGSGRSPSL